MRIERDSPVPLHRQLAEEIRRQILTGEWPASRRMPSETELCDQLRLSRNTVRQALQTLEHEGLVVRITGKGSFVASAHDSIGLGRFIALVIPYSQTQLAATVYSGVHAAAEALGYQVIVVDPIAAGRGAHIVLDRLEAVGICNYLIWPEGEPGEAAHLTGLLGRSHVVQVDWRLPGLGSSLVGCDHREGGILATQHLLDLGHRRIAFLTHPDSAVSVNERREGYEETMRHAGLAPAPALFLPSAARGQVSDLGLNSLAHMTERIGYIVSCLQAADPPTAIFAVNDHVAYQTLVAARQAGLRVPDDLAVVGFDDLPFCADLEVPLTSIRQDGFAIGQTAGELLIRQAEGKQAEPVTVRLPVYLTARASTLGRA